jgi:1-acyl-sn-glycerol-3-phosphate acyltransferase
MSSKKTIQVPIWQKIYTFYGLMVFSTIFLILLPIFFILIQNKKWHKKAISLNRFWALAFFKLIGLPHRVEGEEHFDTKKQYIVCANHFSFIDIASLGSTSLALKFVGKKSLANIPMFGYMYAKLHITVDRSSIKDSYQTLFKIAEAVDAGFSLAIFPEGGILSQHPPAMVKFKEGAFRVAIEKQIPIIPVSIPNNWIILPDIGPLRLSRLEHKVIFHPPIDTQGMNFDDIDDLKKRVREAIESGIKPEEVKQNLNTADII